MPGGGSCFITQPTLCYLQVIKSKQSQMENRNSTDNALQLFQYSTPNQKHQQNILQCGAHYLYDKGSSDQHLKVVPVHHLSPQCPCLWTLPKL